MPSLALRAGKGLLLLLFLVGCPSNDQKWSRSVAEGFLKNTFEGNQPAAKIYTVNDFAFDNWYEIETLIKGHTWTITTEKVSPNGDEAFFEGTWDAAPGKGTFTVLVVKQETKWRVIKFSARKE